MRRPLIWLVCFLFLLPSVHAERFIPKSDLISKVLNIVDRVYVDEKRIVHNSMLEGALDRLSARVAPVLTKVEFKDGKVLINLRVDQFSQNFEFVAPKNTEGLNQILQAVARFTKKHLEADEKQETVDYSLINGFLRKLDPHSLLLIPEVYSDFTTNTSGNFGGVGMMIGLRDGHLTIIAPIDDTPASRVGLRSKDKIVQIDDESTVNMSLSDAVSKLRGKEGTKVVIYILREGYTSAKKYVITRALIKITSVESHVFTMKKKRVGYIKIKTFQKNTLTEINSALEKLDYDLQDFQGVILDLRNNPGGLLDQAIRVSDRFLDSGEIVSTAGLDSRGPRNVKSYSAHWFRSLMDIPMIVLVNNGSASASEIVTAALKKNKRAVVIGAQTFGKGSVQQVIPMPGGAALKLTTSKYLTPGRISIQSVGVTPHIAVLPRYVSPDLLRVTPPPASRAENSLDRNFAEWGDQVEVAEKTTFYLYEDETKPKNKDEKEDEEEDLEKMKQRRLEKDFLVQTARSILFTNQKQDFKHLLKTALDFVESEEKVQEEKMIGKFSEYSTDWKSYDTKSGAELISQAWMEIKGELDGKENWTEITTAVPANSEIRLYLQATNQGSTVLSRLLATTESKNFNFSDRQFAFGKLEKGETKQWYLPIKISESALSRNDLIRFKFTDQEKREVHQTEFSIKIQAKQRPIFFYTISTLEDGTHGSVGNGDGKLQSQETIAVRVDVENLGKGESGSLTLLLKNGEGKKVFLKKGRQKIDSLKTGEKQSIYFTFDLKSSPSDDNLDFSLDIIDGTFPLSSVNQQFKLPVQDSRTLVANQAPKIELRHPALTSKLQSYRISGDIFDDKGVKDMYIFNSKKKVFYKNFKDGQNRKKVRFSLELDLTEENNQIIVVTRDDENVRSQKTLYVRYSGSI
ncbi:MAG: hypothetical protein COB67_01395 [SAR324 cluster bacterium]|uniref:PDZ domain-containing protein n=1 Tax=SAR324 cluster bacterium TaxID=2024889 RepID=A0A2A4TAQ9_9DELT|nr:MAG: hypothetical protein COB67_01395 [SAR324 cluster bacterium]